MPYTPNVAGLSSFSCPDSAKEGTPPSSCVSLRCVPPPGGVVAEIGLSACSTVLCPRYDLPLSAPKLSVWTDCFLGLFPGVFRATRPSHSLGPLSDLLFFCVKFVVRWELLVLSQPAFPRRREPNFLGVFQTGDTCPPGPLSGFWSLLDSQSS